MRPRWVIRGYNYGFMTRNPGPTDVDYIPGYIWVNIITNLAFMLNSLTEGVASWLSRGPDSILNEGTIGQVNIIGENSVGGITRATGGGIVSGDYIPSLPMLGERKITNIRVDANNKLVATYE